MLKRLIESFSNMDDFTCDMYGLCDLYKNKDIKTKDEKKLCRMLDDGAEPKEFYVTLCAYPDKEIGVYEETSDKAEDVVEEEDDYISDRDMYTFGLNDCDNFECDEKHIIYDIFDSVNEDVDDGILLDLGDDLCGEICMEVVKLGVPEEDISQVKKSPVEYNNFDSVYIVYMKDGTKRLFGVHGEEDGEEFSIEEIKDGKRSMRRDYVDADVAADMIDEDADSRDVYMRKFDDAMFDCAENVSDDECIYGDFGNDLSDAVKCFIVTADNNKLPTAPVRKKFGNCSWEDVLSKVNSDKGACDGIALCLLSNTRDPIYNKYKGCVDAYLNLREAYANFKGSKKVINESVELTKQDKEKIVNFLKDVLIKNGADSDCTVKVSTSQNKTITMTSGWHILQKDTVQKNELFKYLRSVGLKGIKSVNEYAQDTYKDPRFGTMHYMSTITAEYTDRFIENVVGKKMSGNTIVHTPTQSPQKSLKESVDYNTYKKVSDFMGSDRCVVTESDGESDCLGFNVATTIPNTDIQAFVCKLSDVDVVVARKIDGGKVFLIFKNKDDMGRYISSVSRKSSAKSVADADKFIDNRYFVMYFDGKSTNILSKFSEKVLADEFIRNSLSHLNLRPVDIRNIYIYDSYLHERVADDSIYEVLNEDAVEKEIKEKDKVVDEIINRLKSYTTSNLKEIVNKVVSLMYGNDMTNAYEIIKESISKISDNVDVVDTMSKLLGGLPVNTPDEFFKLFDMNKIDDRKYSKDVVFTLLMHLFDKDSLLNVLGDILKNMGDAQVESVKKIVEEGSEVQYEIVQEII